ncbi:putative ferric-chelate reductase 1 homolog [Culicoides brevitarsis]|uniref:putative ferric-chelate reductase 1 homolog n=1 Tax=Culicoides brevitarsis TaxID=469753 RepID=UPI00307BC334
MDDEGSTLLRLHGTFMVLGWILAASVGHVIARYFKKTWMIWRIYSYDVWFVIHVCCMGALWLFTLIGFLVVVIDVKGLRAGWHEIIGIFLVLCTLAFPIAVFYGPDKESPYYKKWNMGHFAVGSGLHVIAIINIFLAMRLDFDFLESWISYSVGSFLIFYIFSHLTFSVLDYLGDQKEEQRSIYEDKAYSKYRQAYLGLFTFLLLIYSIHLIQILWR